MSLLQFLEHISFLSYRLRSNISDNNVNSNNKAPQTEVFARRRCEVIARSPSTCLPVFLGCRSPIPVNCPKDPSSDSLYDGRYSLSSCVDSRFTEQALRTTSEDCCWNRLRLQKLGENGMQGHSGRVPCRPKGMSSDNAKELVVNQIWLHVIRSV